MSGTSSRKGPGSKNGNSIAYAEEGAINPIQKLYMANNTIVNEYPNANSRWAVLLGSGVTEAEMVNNLIVGLPSSSHVADGAGAGVLHEQHDIITNSPGFYDQAARSYYLTADFTRGQRRHRSGRREWLFTHAALRIPAPCLGCRAPGFRRARRGSVRVYPNQVCARGADNRLHIQFTSRIRYPGDAQLVVDRHVLLRGQRRLVGLRSRPQAATLRLGSPQENRYSISCTGAGGTVSKSLSVSVNEAPAAAALGTYTWQDIPNSKISTICAGNLAAYKDNLGTGPACAGLTTGVYVPDTETWYLMGGAGYRNYHGNEVYGFNLNTMRPEMVTTPDHIRQTKEYVSNPSAGGGRFEPLCL